MYLSRITLHTSELSPAQLLHLVERGEYVMHQWLWDLFPGSKERQFLYRREELQGAFRFLFSHRNSLPPARFLTCRLAHLRQR
ncbi:CRISPR-associated protein, Cse3 family [Salmonella enterica subsp. enterica serovar Heidelberg str. 75-3547]|nr:CRISPR-associated protein, Cse3 family [Salmonella enterica subsp. enterica serovar Heidelberg str. 75-3547]